MTIRPYTTPRFAPLPPAKGHAPKAADRIDWQARTARHTPPPLNT